MKSGRERGSSSPQQRARGGLFQSAAAPLSPQINFLQMRGSRVPTPLSLSLCFFCLFSPTSTSVTFYTKHDCVCSSAVEADVAPFSTGLASCSRAESYYSPVVTMTVTESITSYTYYTYYTYSMTNLL